MAQDTPRGRPEKYVQRWTYLEGCTHDLSRFSKGFIWCYKCIASTGPLSTIPTLNYECSNASDGRWHTCGTTYPVRSFSREYWDSVETAPHDRVQQKRATTMPASKKMATERYRVDASVYSTSTHSMVKWRRRPEGRRADRFSWSSVQRKKPC